MERKCAGPDNQEVGLEAATLERVRNSSLVESARADNVAGIKSATEAVDVATHGRGASCAAEKQERKRLMERTRVRMPV